MTSITMILSLLVCAGALGLVVAGMALPIRLLPEETGGGPVRGPGGRRRLEATLSRFSGDSQVRLAP